MASGTIKKPAAHIERGTITSGSISGGSYTDFGVTFDQAFDTAPTIVASVCSYTGQSNNVLVLRTISATTTGGTITVSNLSGSSISLSASRLITWIAAG